MKNITLEFPFKFHNYFSKTNLANKNMECEYKLIML